MSDDALQALVLAQQARLNAIDAAHNTSDRVYQSLLDLVMEGARLKTSLCTAYAVGAIPAQCCKCDRWFIPYQFGTHCNQCINASATQTESP